MTARRRGTAGGRNAAGRPATRSAARRPASSRVVPSAQVNRVELAYERIERMLVDCRLAPGRLLALQDLQKAVGLGRTPVHQAVIRLASDTLVIVRPRHGLQIRPIDLARERALLPLRRDIESFVIRLAIRRLDASQRNQMLSLLRALTDPPEPLTVDRFNLVDRRIDALLLATAGEPFVDHTLRPLHTLFRRIGWLYHAKLDVERDIARSVEQHARLLDHVVHGRAERAVGVLGELIDFLAAMFDALEREVDPALLDCSLAYLRAA